MFLADMRLYMYVDLSTGICGLGVGGWRFVYRYVGWGLAICVQVCGLGVASSTGIKMLARRNCLHGATYHIAAVSECEDQVCSC